MKKLPSLIERDCHTPPEGASDVDVETVVVVHCRAGKELLTKELASLIDDDCRTPREGASDVDLETVVVLRGCAWLKEPWSKEPWSKGP